MSSRLDTITDWDVRAQRAKFHVATLASQCGITERQLRRYFRRKFGVSPNLWLATARLELIPQLLQRGQSVKEIAAQTGFSQPGNLTRRFKQRYRVPPSALRHPAPPKQSI
jgi:AraC family transcriptional regulator of adaptative response / DNA-3-methyladenine glycosylase II